MINYEIKSQLAKLLATEDLVVENRNIETAQFNVETRVLTLPMWQKASESVYDMLVGHEVGHALYTPNDWSFEERVPKGFVNVTEDARIEKLMKRRYPGLAKSFYKGYKEFSDEDFFNLETQNISELNLVDRINLYYKIGNFVDVPFTEEEQKFVQMTGESETFADAVMVAEEIYKYCKEEKENKVEAIIPPSASSSDGGDEQEKNETEDQGSDEEDFGELEDLSEGRLKPEEPEEPQVQTDEAFTSGTQELTSTSDGFDPRYIEMPELDIEKFIVKNSDIHSELEAHFAGQQVETQEYDSYTKQYKTVRAKDFSQVDAKYDFFKKSAQKEVNYMVKEFECKKSADAYARASVSKTGVLDCTKLHTYKYNEDLFKKVTILPDGKNHGLLFILDWSGSMGDCILDTIKQLYNLIWFCQKVNIPFDVYAFTNNYIKSDYSFDRYNLDTLDTQNVEDNVFLVDPNFSLMQLFTSSVRKPELEKQLKNIWRVTWTHRFWSNYSIPNNLSLSGTPLHEALACLHTLIPAFQEKYNLQKVNVFILTDGEANSLSSIRKGTYYGKEDFCISRITANDFLRNRKTGHTYKNDFEFYKFTEIMLRDLNEVFPYVNFIGLRIAGTSDFKTFIRRYSTYTEEKFKQYKKQKYVQLNSTGYTSYVAMLESALNNESDFTVEEGATKAKIKNAFVKNMKASALNKKVLSQFMNLIC